MQYFPRRRSVITLIPRKEDGSWTDKVKDMRPISVLQEFGKIAAKILAERWGKVLLEHPQILNSAQRAFLKDGCVQQCVSTALNIFEDFQDRKDNKESFTLYHTIKKRHTTVSKHSRLRPRSNASTCQKTHHTLCFVSRMRPVVSRHTLA